MIIRDHKLHLLAFSECDFFNISHNTTNSESEVHSRARQLVRDVKVAIRREGGRKLFKRCEDPRQI